MQPHEESVIDSIEDIAAEKDFSSTSLADYDAKLSLEAALHGKPKMYACYLLKLCWIIFHSWCLVVLCDWKIAYCRLCQPVKEISDAPQSSKEQVEFENILVASPLEVSSDGFYFYVFL